MEKKTLMISGICIVSLLSLAVFTPALKLIVPAFRYLLSGRWMYNTLYVFFRSLPGFALPCGCVQI